MYLEVTNIFFMKKIVFLFYLLFVQIYAQGIPTDSTLYVFAPSGLSLREAPNSTAKKLTIIPYRSEVTIIAQTRDYIEIVEAKQFKFSDQWVKVKYQNQIGYAFMGYLTHHAPPSNLIIQNDTFDKDLKYLEEAFGGKGTKEGISNFGDNYTDCENNEDCICEYSYYFEKGVSYNQESCNEISTEGTIIIPNSSLLFGYHLIKLLFDTNELMFEYNETVNQVSFSSDGAGCTYTAEMQNNVLVISFFCSC